MEIEKIPPSQVKPRSFSLQAKFILGIAVLSAFVSFITARGIYTILGSQFTEKLRADFVTQSIYIFFFAVGLGIFFGLVVGRVLTESIVKLTKSAKDFA
jgi:hypothetical protein